MKKIAVADLIKDLSQKLQLRNTTGNAIQEAWWILEKLTNQSQASLVMAQTLILDEQQQQTLDHWISQRVDEKKPLQYILGSVPFCSLDILVQPPVLIPRPETEEMVCWLIDIIKKSSKTKISILDLCCGSGCIGLALAHALPEATVLGTDISPHAVCLA
ncbi:MAG: HemK family protein methyltransferase, partial [bacterium]